jgi:TetR/AcrR family transcriptional regulator, transcriptional repressor for nem operon
MKKPVAAKKRNLEKSRKEILGVAFFEVFTHGFQGVSVDDIGKKTSMTKGAFYHHFPGKLDLGYALVDEVIKPLIIERWIAPLNHFKNPLEGILSQMEKLIGECPPELLKFGCPLNNLVQEMAPIDHGFAKRLKSALDLWIDKMDEHLIRGQADGFIKSDVNTREVALFVVMAHEGFYGLIKGLGSSGVFQALSRSMKIYFQTISTLKSKNANRRIQAFTKES